MLPPTFYPLTTQKSWQSLLLEDDRLRLSTATVRDADAFAEKWEKKSVFRAQKEILIADISSFAHPEQSAKRLTVFAGGKKVFFDFKNAADLQAVVVALQAKLGRTPATQSVSAFRAVQGYLGGLFFVLLFGVITYVDARTLEQGGAVDTSGRRAGFKKLLAWLAGELGTVGTALVFGGLALAIVAFMVRAARKPPGEVVYS